MIIQCDVAIGAVALDQGPMRGAVGVVMEDAVLNQLAVKAAIVGVIDLLGHQSVEGWADLDAGVLEINVQCAGVGLGESDQEAEGNWSSARGGWVS